MSPVARGLWLLTLAELFSQTLEVDFVSHVVERLFECGTRNCMLRRGRPRVSTCRHAARILAAEINGNWQQTVLRRHCLKLSRETTVCDIAPHLCRGE